MDNFSIAISWAAISDERAEYLRSLSALPGVRVRILAEEAGKEGEKSEEWRLAYAERTRGLDLRKDFAGDMNDEPWPSIAAAWLAEIRPDVLIVGKAGFGGLPGYMAKHAVFKDVRKVKWTSLPKAAQEDPATLVAELKGMGK